MFCVNVMWWIVLIVVAVILLLIIVVIVASSSSYNKGDYNDGGGTQIGGDESIPFFAPANDKAGMWGERVTNYHLRPLLRNDEYLLANLLLPLRNGHKTEIDCVLISRKGIFCIETKNWVGHIKGSDDDEVWIQEYDDPSMVDRHHDNPVIQNEKHCAILEKVLNNRYPVDNIVIFVDLDYWDEIDSKYVYSINEFKNYYRELNDDEINQEELKQIYQKLLRYVATEEELKQHREDVKRRYN